MKHIRRLFITLSTATAAAVLLSLPAHANVQEITVPDAGSSALMLCGAIAAIAVMRRRQAK